MAELTPKQQVVEILRNQKRFLILTHQNVDGDALGSMLALYLSLKRLGKEVVAFSGDSTPNVFSFLPELNSVDKSFNGSRAFVISVDIKDTKADKIMYKVQNDKLNIIITPKEGLFEEKMVSFTKGQFNFDAIIVLDATDLERLGSVYEEYPEMFYEVPVVNIDHHAGNDHFGKINLVDLTATSTSEILVSVIEALTGDPKFFDEKIATALLTGIITDTNSFQNTNTTPKSLTVAAQLVAAGGEQQEIIKNIYKTKPLSTLRLWGRALTNLHDESEYKFVWSQIYKKDYLEVGAAEDESSGLIDELLKTASGMDFALLLSEKNGDVHGSLRSTNRTKDTSEIAKLFGGGGHPLASGFQINETSLLESSNMIIEKIKNYQRGQNQ
jgi:phosphoesterase RecJ-like protein